VRGLERMKRRLMAIETAKKPPTIVINVRGSKESEPSFRLVIGKGAGTGYE